MTDAFRKRAWVLAAALAACAPPAVVIVSRSYDPAQIRRVALVSFSDFPGAPGSGDIVASTFEKYLLMADYGLVERRQVSQIMGEQSLQVSGGVDPATARKLGRILGVDALIFGGITDFTNTRNHTVLVDMPQEHSEPIYGEVVTVRHAGDTTVRSAQSVVTGYHYWQTNRMVPEEQTVPAHIGLSVRLVAVQTGEVLWSASAGGSGSDLSGASEEASSALMQGVVKRLKKKA